MFVGMFLKCLVLLFLVESSSVCSAQKHRKMSLSKNMAIAKQWSCSVPQPRLIHIDSLEEYRNKANVFYQPPAVVVHRCDQSTGCCMKLGEVCTPIEQDEEEVNFVVLQIEHSSFYSIGNGKHKRQNNHGPAVNKEKIHIHLRNHTTCECATRVNNRS